jgi:hypothetical protein
VKKQLLIAFGIIISLPAFAQFEPMTITGFNNDIIANGTGNASASTTIAVDQANWNLVSPDFKATAASTPPTAALPASGIINSPNTPGLKFQLANYTGNNGLVLTTSGSSGDLNFSITPTGDVYVLGFTGNGPTTTDITVKFTDNSTQVATAISFEDWYGGSGFAIQDIGRVQRLTNALEAPAGNPRMYEKKITLLPANAGKKISGIKVTKTNATGVLNIVAVTVACRYPTITTQPLNKEICPGDNTSFSITANNASSYQWQVNTGSGFTNITDNAIYSGSTTPTLNLANVPASFSNYKYQCITTGTCGNTTSAAGTLSFIPPVSVTPEGVGGTACEGGSTSLSVQTSGAILSYKWQINSNTGYIDLPSEFPYKGCNTPKLEIEKFMDTMANRKFRCIVTGHCSNATSADMSIGIIPSPHITTHPTDQTIDVDKDAFFEIAGTGNNVGYIWQASWNESKPFVNISDNAFYFGVNSPKLKVMQAPYPYNGVRFRCILKSFDATCSIFDTSNVGVLYIRHTGVGNVNEDNKFSIYPNPVSGNEVSIFSTQISASKVNITVMDKLGRTVLNKSLQPTNNNINISLDGLAEGMYYIKATDEQQQVIFNSRFIKL